MGLQAPPSAAARPLPRLLVCLSVLFLLHPIPASGEGATVVGGNHPTEFARPVSASVSSVHPSIGSRNGGQRITIAGSGFSTDFMNGANTVTIGGEECKPVNFFGGGCTVDCTTSERIVCLTGEISIGSLASKTVTGDVTVDDTFDLEDAFSFTYDQDIAGTLTDIVPSSVRSGTVVNLIGEGWDRQAEFVRQFWAGKMFNSTPCAAGRLNYHPLDWSDPTNYVSRDPGDPPLRPEDSMFDDQHFRCGLHESLVAGYVRWFPQMHSERQN